MVLKAALLEFRCLCVKVLQVCDFFHQVVGRHFQEEMVIHAMKTIEELLNGKM